MSRMKAKTVDEIFGYTDEIIDKTNQERIAETIRSANRAAIKVGKSFARQFASAMLTSIQSGYTPDLGQYSPPDWKPLSKKTLALKKKKKSRFVNTFFRFKDQLRTSISGSDSYSVFGTPTAYIVGGVGAGAVRVSLSDRGNLSIWDMKGGSGGRRGFGAFLAKKRINLVIDLLPRVNTGGSDASQVDNIRTSAANKRKLKGRGRANRPALTPYAAWWVNNVAEPRIRKEIKL